MVTSMNTKTFVGTLVIIYLVIQNIFEDLIPKILALDDVSAFTAFLVIPIPEVSNQPNDY